MFWKKPNPDTSATMRWLLDKRLEDIRQSKAEQWKYAYTAVIAQSAIFVLLLAKPENVVLFHRLVAAVMALGVFGLWREAHTAALADLTIARESKDLIYNELGPQIVKLLAVEPSDSQVLVRRKVRISRACWLAVTGATLITITSSWIVAKPAFGFKLKPDNATMTLTCGRCYIDSSTEIGKSAVPRISGEPNQSPTRH
jgi:hypothetical protein